MQSNITYVKRLKKKEMKKEEEELKETTKRAKQNKRPLQYPT